jgi:hypothetical protein
MFLLRESLVIPRTKDDMRRIFRRSEAKPAETRETATQLQVDDSEDPTFKTPALIQASEQLAGSRPWRRNTKEIVSDV